MPSASSAFTAASTGVQTGMPGRPAAIRARAVSAPTATVPDVHENPIAASGPPGASSRAPSVRWSPSRASVSGVATTSIGIRVAYALDPVGQEGGDVGAGRAVGGEQQQADGHGPGVVQRGGQRGPGPGVGGSHAQIMSHSVRLPCRGLTPKLLRSGSDPHNFHARKTR